MCFDSQEHSYYQLSREDQVIMVRRKTGHSRLGNDMFTHTCTYSQEHSYYQLSREDQVIMVRMKTGHSRLGNDTFAKFFGDSTVCQCGTSLMTVERFLQDCQTHQNLRAEPWPADTPVREKIYGPVENLQRTAAYVRATGVPV